MLMIQPVATTITQTETTKPNTPTYISTPSSIGLSSLSGLAPLPAEGSPCSGSGFLTARGFGLYALNSMVSLALYTDNGGESLT